MARGENGNAARPGNRTALGTWTTLTTTKIAQPHVPPQEPAHGAGERSPLVAALDAIIDNPGLSWRAKLVACVLVRYADRDGRCWPSERVIAGRAGVTDRTVRRALAELRREGLLRVEPRRGRSSVYCLTPLAAAPRNDSPGSQEPRNVSPDPPEPESGVPRNVSPPTPEPQSAHPGTSVHQKDPKRRIPSEGSQEKDPNEGARADAPPDTPEGRLALRWLKRFPVSRHRSKRDIAEWTSRVLAAFDEALKAGMSEEALARAIDEAPPGTKPWDVTKQAARPVYPVDRLLAEETGRRGMRYAGRGSARGAGPYREQPGDRDPSRYSDWLAPTGGGKSDGWA